MNWAAVVWAVVSLASAITFLLSGLAAIWKSKQFGTTKRKRK